MQIPKVLGQSNPTAATLTALYRVPACSSVKANTLIVCNRSSTATSFRVAIAPKAEADAVQHYLYYDHALAGNATHAAVLELTLCESDEVRVYAANATVSFSLFGVESL